MQSGLFKTFIGVIGKAKAEDSLNSGPVTVFMPTDRAFALLTQAQRDAILALSPDDARNFINHFIIPGVALETNDIDPDITAVDGTSYNVTWYQGRLSLRDHQGPAKGKLAFVVNGDNPAGQGVLNAIDAVLLPVPLERPSETEAAKVQVAPTNEASAPKAIPADASPPSVAAPVAASSTPRAEAASAPQISAPSGSSNGTSSKTQPLKPAGVPIVSQSDQAAAFRFANNGRAGSAGGGVPVAGRTLTCDTSRNSNSACFKTSDQCRDSRHTCLASKDEQRHDWKSGSNYGRHPGWAHHGHHGALRWVLRLWR